MHQTARVGEVGTDLQSLHPDTFDCRAGYDNDGPAVGTGTATATDAPDTAAAAVSAGACPGGRLKLLRPTELYSEEPLVRSLHPAHRDP